MVVNRALRATSCASCRLSLLRSFTVLAGPPIGAPLIASRFRRCQTPTQPRQSSRLASKSGQWEGDVDEGKQARVVQEEAEKEPGNHEDPLEETQVFAVPWYLQVETPQRAPQPLSERHRVPELPEAPPLILQALLQQISVDLGLDDLSLLDLRKLDPPPALGANLLMIIGTARSEKHLHVSADRLCRWLRSTYKLRPDADGLLGRNELKLKLKRKAKRAKLMGNTSDLNADDGVRTGWVCVDVGVVEGAEGEAVPPPRHDFVGFGRRTDGVRIVVQMMTEEKREEIDLEKLWAGILRRGGQFEFEGIKEDAESFDPLTTSTPKGFTEPMQRAATTGPASIIGQTRGIHTSARRLSRERETNQASTSPTADGFEEFDLNAIRESTTHDIVSGDYRKAMNNIRQLSEYVPQLQNGGWKLFLLDLLRTHLQSLPKDQALQELGDPESSHPTAFMKCFKEALSMYPTQFEAEFRIWLYVYARELEHPYYTMGILIALFEELQGNGVRISRPAYKYLLGILVRPGVGGGICYRALKTATNILQAMYDQGLNILDEEILVELQEATSAGPPKNVNPIRIFQHPHDTCDLPSLPMSPTQRRLHVLTKAIDLPPFSDESRMRLLDLHARNQHWLEFWDVFRMAPRQGQPQSASMYAFMFDTIAQTRNQKACMNVLRAWAPEMEREQPPVTFEGDVAEAVKACLKVADPYVEQTAINSPDLPGEWLSLWRQCRPTEGQNDLSLYEQVRRDTCTM